MRVIKPLVAVETPIDTETWGKKLEYYTRKCYKSEGKTGPDTYKDFIRRVFRTMKHEGIIEHFSVSVTMISDRGVSHEHVRHRMASYLQESTRYVNYSKNGVTFILPPWVDLSIPFADNQMKFLEANDFIEDCKSAERRYNRWLNEYQWKPQQARYFLPNGIKTEYVATHNLGSWFNFFNKRTSPQAHPQIRQLAVPLLRYFQEKLPFIYDGMELPVLEYPEAPLIEHFGTDPLDDYFQEVFSS